MVQVYKSRKSYKMFSYCFYKLFYFITLKGHKILI